MYGQNVPGQIAYMGESIAHGSKPTRPVYLDGTRFYSAKKMTQVAPVHPGHYHQGNAPPGRPMRVFEKKSPDEGVVYETLKPIILLMKGMGMMPIGFTSPGVFAMTTPLIVYSVFVFLVVVGYLGYIKWDKVEIVRSAEAKFEEAVIDYLFMVYLLPVVIIPIAWHESRKLSVVFCNWWTLERIYLRVSSRSLPLFLGNKVLVMTILLPLLSSATMTVTHITMVNFRLLQVIPYCFINTITYLVGGFWYIHCDIIGEVALIIADDFQKSLKHVGPSSKVADYRTLWMMLSKLMRDVGIGTCYTLTFLTLYLFLIITLTIYGLLSQIQNGLGIKDIGLTNTAVFAVALLFFVCDEAHYASNCVRVQFQKILLLVELTWMNDDAQQEINMFLRATEMNPTALSLGGFFDVNRNLFKSLLATMVTYLVVLLQFQISIPEDGGISEENNGNLGNTTSSVLTTDSISTSLTSILTTMVTMTTKAPKT